MTSDMLMKLADMKFPRKNSAIYSKLKASNLQHMNLGL